MPYRETQMKVIIATKKVLGVLGDTKAIIYHYADGSKREHLKCEKRTPEQTQEVLKYMIEQFNKREIK